MSIHRKLVVISMFLALLLAAALAACGPAETEVAATQALTEPTAESIQPEVAPPTEAPTNTAQPPATGFISGLVYGSPGPPNPPMVVYAVNINSGTYSSIETPQTQAEAPYTMEIPPGTYLLYAFAIEEYSGYAGYSEDGWTLTPLTITAGQILTDVTIRPPSQTQCGAMLRLPASPDGRFAEIPGPTDECMAAAIAEATAQAGAVAEPDQLESELMRIEFPPGGTVSQLHSSLLAGGADHYVLKASAGQTMIVDLQSAGNAILIIWGANGVVLISEQASAANWMSELTLTQDYYIDVRSVASETSTYSMDVIIPPSSSSDQAPTPSSPTSNTNEDKTPGAISGGISYPASTVPAFHVVAYNVDNSYWYWVGFTPNTWAYSITDLPPGTYNIVAYPDGAGLEGGYAETGGTALLPVKVEPGKTTSGITINIWVEPAASSFPSDPL